MSADSTRVLHFEIIKSPEIIKKIRRKIKHFDMVLFVYLVSDVFRRTEFGFFARTQVQARVG